MAGDMQTAELIRAGGTIPEGMQRDHVNVVFQLFAVSRVRRMKRFICWRIVWLCFSTYEVETSALTGFPSSRCLQML
jgi:hypothetical protein